MRWLVLVLLAFSLKAFPQEKSETKELGGHLGGRPALLTLNVLEQQDGSARLAGEYVVLPTLQHRYLEGERSKQLGVTFLREGNSQILYGRAASATLQGLWSGAVLKGARYGPGGQHREQFEFSENFPSLEAYSAEVRCQTSEGAYASTLSFAVAGGKLKSFEWRSTGVKGEKGCELAGLKQEPFKGGLRFAADGCRVTLREVGEFVKVASEGCAQQCSAQAGLEPVVVDRKGTCTLLRAQGK